jgi:putative DNA primase/helicase
MNARLMPIDKHAAPYLAVDIDALDADPWKFNVANGTLIFDCAARSVSLKPHDPADLITKISPVAYDPAATCPDSSIASSPGAGKG